MAIKEIETIEDLAGDLAGKYRGYQGNSAASPSVDPQIEADLERLQRDGYIVVEGLLQPSQVAALRNKLLTSLAYTGRNTFEGLQTQRLYNVFSYTDLLDEVAAHPRVLALLSAIFEPNYLISQAQAINILPGESAQLLHYDEGFYKLPRPREAVGASTIFALDAFTEDNGATLVAPASHRWGDDRVASKDDVRPVVMPAGSMLFFFGTLWHGGGANRSDAARLAVTCQYCEPWLRQQENFLLELPKERVKSMPRVLQDMVGYSIYPPFMGAVNGCHPRRLLDDENK